MLIGVLLLMANLLFLVIELYGRRNELLLGLLGVNVILMAGVLIMEMVR